jgi:hypothetical protein
MLVKCVVPPLHIREVLRSNLGLGTSYTEEFYGFPQFLYANAWKVPQIRPHYTAAVYILPIPITLPFDATQPGLLTAL